MRAKKKEKEKEKEKEKKRKEAIMHKGGESKRWDDEN